MRTSKRANETGQRRESEREIEREGYTLYYSGVVFCALCTGLLKWSWMHKGENASKGLERIQISFTLLQLLNLFCVRCEWETAERRQTRVKYVCSPFARFIGPALYTLWYQNVQTLTQANNFLRCCCCRRYHCYCCWWDFFFFRLQKKRKESSYAQMIRLSLSLVSALNMNIVESFFRNTISQTNLPFSRKKIPCRKRQKERSVVS